MAQGLSKRQKKPGLKKGANNRKALNVIARMKKVKKGNSFQIPKRNGVNRDEALDDSLLSKEIAKASEKKCAAKLIQNGSKLAMNDLRAKGKEMNRDARREKLVKKVGRVDAKINKLIVKADR
jgi:hypothetical protein